MGEREDYDDPDPKGRELPSLLTLAAMGVCVTAVGALLVEWLLLIPLPGGPTD
jgi:hypothetical protein